MTILAKILIAILTVLVGQDADAYAVTDMRVCRTQSTVVRDADGKIARSPEVLKRFREIHPCPSTGLPTGKCNGWALDHVIPLACGGCDSIENLQWLKNSIKSCPGKDCKDRWERKINCSPTELVR